MVVEPDQGGETVRRRLAKSRLRDRAYLVDLAPSVGKTCTAMTLNLALTLHFLSRPVSLAVTDTAEQTRAVMRATAQPVRSTLDVTPWLALQT